MKLIVLLLNLLFVSNVMASDWQNQFIGEINFSLNEDQQYSNHLEAMQILESEVESARVTLNDLRVQLNQNENYLNSKRTELANLNSQLRSQESNRNQEITRLNQLRTNIVNIRESLRLDKKEYSKTLRILDNKQQRMNDLLAQRSAITEELKRFKRQRDQKQARRDNKSQDKSQKVVKLNQFKRDLSKLQNQITRLEEKIRNLRTEISGLESEIQSLQTTLRSKRQELKNIQNKIANLERIVQPKREEIKGHKRSRTQLISQRDALRNEVNQIKNEIQNLNSIIKKLNNEVSQLQNKITGSKNAIVKFKQEIQSLKSKINNNQNIISQNEPKLERLANKINEAIKKCIANNPGMSARECRQKPHIQDLSNQRKEVSKIMAKAKKEIENFNQQIVSYNEKIQSNRRDITNNEQQIKSKQNNINQRQSSLNSKKQQLNNKKTALSAKQNEIKKVDGLISRLEQQIASEVAQINSFKEQEKNLKAQLKSINQNISRKESSLNQKRTLLSTSQNDISNKRREVNNIKQQIPQLENQISRLTNEIASLDEQIRELDRQINPLENRRRNINQTIQPLEREIAQLQNSANSLAQRITNQENRIRRLNNDIENTQRMLAQLEENINSLITQVNITEQEINQTLGYINNLNNSIRQEESRLTQLSSQLATATSNFNNVKSELIAQILENNQEGVEHAVSPESREGSAMAQELGNSRGSSDGQRDGTHQGQTNGQNREYQTGYNETYPIGFSRGQNQGIAKGKIDGTASGNTKAGEIFGKKDGIKRAINSDAAKSGMIAGKKVGLELAIKYGKKEGAPVGAKQAQDHREQAQLKEIITHGPFAGTFSANIPTYPGADRRNFRYLRSPGRPVVKKAYEAGYLYKYLEQAQSTFEREIAEIYNNSYQENYEQSYQEMFNRHYEQSYKNGRTQGLSTGQSEGYQDKYQVTKDEYEKKFTNSPDIQSVEYKNSFDKFTAKWFEIKYQEIFETNKTQFTVSEEKKQKPIQFEKFRKLEFDKVENIYLNNPVLKFETITHKDMGFKNISPSDGIYQKNEFFNTNLVISNFGSAQAKDVVISDAQGKQTKVNVAALGKIIIKGAHQQRLPNKLVPHKVSYQVRAKKLEHPEYTMKFFENRNQGILKTNYTSNIAMDMPFEILSLSFPNSLMVGDSSNIEIRIKNKSKVTYSNIDISLNLQELGLDSQKITIDKIKSNTSKNINKSINIKDADLSYKVRSLSTFVKKKNLDLVEKSIKKETFIRIAYSLNKDNILLISSKSRTLPREYFDFLAQLGGHEEVAILDQHLYSNIDQIQDKIENKNIAIINASNNNELIKQIIKKSQNNVIASTVNLEQFLDQHQLNQLMIGSYLKHFPLGARKVYFGHKLLGSQENLLTQIKLNELDSFNKIRQEYLNIDAVNNLLKINENQYFNPTQTIRLSARRLNLLLDHDIIAYKRKGISGETLLDRLIQLSKAKKGIESIAFFTSHYVERLKKLSKEKKGELRKYFRKASKYLRRGAKKQLGRKLYKKVLEQKVDYTY